MEVTTSIADDAAKYGASWDSSTGSTEMTRLGDAVSAPEVREGATPAEIGPYFDECAPWSGMKLCNVADDGTINATIDDGDSFKRDGSNGQVMVKIPKFYYKHIYENDVHEFWVADGPAEGFKLHPAFIRAGEEKEYILMGAYKASLGRNQANTADALASVSGQFPVIGRNISEYRNLAKARGKNTGANWMQTDVLTRNAVALLYLVEYADTNSQAAIGKGITDLRFEEDIIAVASTNANTIIVSSSTAGLFSKGQIVGVGTSLGGGQICKNRMITGISAPVDGKVTITVDGTQFSTTTDPVNYIYHVAQKTGGCDDLNGDSGSASTYSDGETPGVDGKVSVSYRGLEDLWGNVWEFVDGINIKNLNDSGEPERQPYVANSGFVNEKFDENYKPSGVRLPTDYGYIKDFACSAEADWLLMPSTVGGSTSTYIPDYYYQSWGSANKVALVGGYWHHGPLSGLFRWDVGASVTYAYLDLGARVLLVP